jgi:hypothetical protein
MHDFRTAVENSAVVFDLVVGMEIADDSFSGLEFFAVGFLLLEQFFFILGAFIFQVFLSFLNHIINVLRLFVNSPSLVNFTFFESVLVLVHNHVNFAVPFYLNSHLLDLVYD